MKPDNYEIADQFSLLAKLMDIHGENAFKSKSYAIAAYNIEKLPVQLNQLNAADIFTLKGIGESTGRKILEILEHQKLQPLQEIISKTPPGILEMLHIKGLGPKKIHTIWKEMQIESIGELLYACHENRLMLFKGFGAKTQKNVQEAIEFFQLNRESFLFAEVEPWAMETNRLLKSTFEKNVIMLTGNLIRQMESLDQVEWLTDIPIEELEGALKSMEMECIDIASPRYTFKGKGGIPAIFTICSSTDIMQYHFEMTCSEEFLLEWKERFNLEKFENEEDYFKLKGIQFIPHAQRESVDVIDRAVKNKLEKPIEVSDIKGIIHSHSNWSDGVHTIEEMALSCMQKGFEYLVISDHSKSAFYANGLSEERIKAQHQYIDELNHKYPNFRIFKSIECDILNDGQLDYSNQILSTFDLVIASIHSNLKMTEEKAMERLLKAIENPYTRILGHLTGRLLLSRKGYPVDHEKIIESCKSNHVAIELNAHPRRLDIDWRNLRYMMEMGVITSINPDAHHIDGFNDIRYGVLVAQKAGLTSNMNLSCYSKEAFESFVTIR